MTTSTAATETTTQVHRVYIKASAQSIWQAITDPEWTNRYGYTGYANYDLRRGGKFEINPNEEFKAGAKAQGYDCPDPIIDGEVIEVDPPNKLVTTWRMLMDPQLMAEGFTKLTYEIQRFDGYCALTVRHELSGAPQLAAVVGGQMESSGAGGGHAWVLSDLKSLLETGNTMAA
jgi:uncharacterized protein YndB with AHSA1/START domain